MNITGFTRKNPLPLPIEDSFGYNESGNILAIAVADGITRDPLGMPYLPDPKDMEGVWEACRAYPNPSGSKIVADLFVKNFIEYPMGVEWAAHEQTVFNGFTSINNRLIKRLNKERIKDVDYLEHDLFGCVASAGIIAGDKLFYGYIGDCGVAVFDRKGKIVDKTTDDVKKTSRFVEALADYDWKRPEWREVVRKKYRNKPGNLNSYGALTGEVKANWYIHTGKINLTPGFFVLFYSDGMEDVVLSMGLSEHLASIGLDGLERKCNDIADEMGIRKEGTLVAVAVD